MRTDRKERKGNTQYVVGHVNEAESLISCQILHFSPIKDTKPPFIHDYYLILQQISRGRWGAYPGIAVNMSLENYGYRVFGFLEHLKRTL